MATRKKRASDAACGRASLGEGVVSPQSLSSSHPFSVIAPAVTVVAPPVVVAPPITSAIRLLPRLVRLVRRRVLVGAAAGETAAAFGLAAARMLRARRADAPLRRRGTGAGARPGTVGSGLCSSSPAALRLSDWSSSVGASAAP